MNCDVYLLRGAAAIKTSGLGSQTRKRLLLQTSFDVDHLSRHAAVDDEVCPRDESRTAAVEQPGDDFRDVLRLPDAAGGVLKVVLAAQLVVVRRRNPARAHAIYAHVGAEA